MSVSESENLRDNFFELCNFMREKAPILKAHYAESELVALRRAAVKNSSIMELSGRDFTAYRRGFIHS